MSVLLVALAPLLAQQISSQPTSKTTALNAAELVRMRAQWFFRQRASANGHVPGALLLRALAQNKKMIAADGTFAGRLSLRGGAAVPAQNSWTALGPQPTANTMFYGNVSGRVTALTVDPCDATGNTVYAGGADGGVWASFNALSGKPVTWQPLTDEQPSLSTGALALVSSSCQMVNGHMQSQEILVGTGESNYALDNIYGAGVLRSMDGGQTWTQDATFTASASQGPGASGPYIAALAVQPHQANPVILAAVQGTDFAAGGPLLSGVWRSTDGGNHWSRVQPGGGGATGAPFNPATDVKFDPSDSAGGTVYAALGDPNGDSQAGPASCAVAACNGVYVSHDAGVTWSRVAGLDSAATASSYGSISLAIVPGSTPVNSTVWVAIADAGTKSDNLLGVLKGTGIQNNGSGPAFTAIYPNASNLPDFCTPLCFYDMKIAVTPGTAGAIVFAGGSAQPPLAKNAYGTSSIYRSLDGGGTWGDVSADGSGNGTSTHVDVHAFHFAVASGSQVLAMFVGNDGGVWASQDVFNSAVAPGNEHWADLNTDTGNPNTSLNLTQFYPGISIHPSTDKVIFGGTQGNDVQQYSGTLDWSGSLVCPYDGGYTAIDPHTPSTIYAACSYLGGPGTLNKNMMNGVPGTDGINWAAMDFNNGINFSDNADFIPPLALDTKNSANLYFGTYRLYQTNNAGNSWSAITSDLTTNGGQNFVTTIAVAPSDSNTIYVGTSDGLLWVSSKALQGAPDIARVNQVNQPARSVTAIAVDAVNPQAAFAAYSGFSCPGTSGCDGLGHVFFTNNSGAAWIQVDGNLPDVPVNDIVIDPTDATDNTIYIATDAGVYASANATAGAATTWSVLQAGLPNSQVLSLKLRNASRLLVAATHGRGLWSTVLPTLPGFVLTGLDPASTSFGAGSFLLTATGDSFTPQSVINFNGTALATTFVSATTLTATASDAGAACGGAVPVTISDPVLGTTNSLTFSVSGVPCDFSFGSVTPASSTVSPGGTADYQVTLQPVGAANSAVQLTCSIALPGASCQFTPNPATPATGGTKVAMMVSIPASASVRDFNGEERFEFLLGATRRLAWPLAVAMLFALALCAAAMRFAKRRGALAAVCCLGAIVLLNMMAACGGGGGGGGGNQGKTYEITITGTSGNYQHLTSVQVVVD
ncbi:MAG: hypothetical protein WA211_13530 [Candidatus Acidiferrales bacterium]